MRFHTLPSRITLCRFKDTETKVVTISPGLIILLLYVMVGNSSDLSLSLLFHLKNENENNINDNCSSLHKCPTKKTKNVKYFVDCKALCTCYMLWLFTLKIQSKQVNLPLPPPHYRLNSSLSSVQLLSVRLFATPGTVACQLPCPSPTLTVCSNSCPLSRWCHPTISSSVDPFSHLQSFPASGSFLMSRLLIWSGQSTGASASAAVLPMSI